MAAVAEKRSERGAPRGNGIRTSGTNPSPQLATQFAAGHKLPTCDKGQEHPCQHDSSSGKIYTLRDRKEFKGKEPLQSSLPSETCPPPDVTTGISISE